MTPAAIGPRRPPSAIGTTLRFSLLDLVRSRWLPMLVVIAALAAGAGAFGAQLGLTEQGRIALSIAAPLARILAVLVVIVLIVAAIAREAVDRSRQIALAAAVSRGGWILAKWASFVLMALVTAAACGVPVLLLASGTGLAPAEDAVPVHAVFAWTASLALELAIVASIAMTVSLAIGHIAAAILATIAIYCASRLIGVILLLSTHASLGDAQPAATLLDGLLRALGLLLPRLDLFAPTDWLVGGPIDTLAAQAVQAAICCALMLAVATFDFSRREL